jgi:hypothetical protein
MRQLSASSWLRRALEAALVSGLVAIVSLVGGLLSAGADLVALPRGPTGVLLLAPSVLALGVIPVAWPAAMAATRSDALFGSLAGFLIAADAAVILARGRVLVEGTSIELPAGFLAVLLAVVPAVAGVLGGQLGSAVGFGRNAGARSAIAAALATVFVLGGLAVLQSAPA